MRSTRANAPPDSEVAVVLAPGSTLVCLGLHPSSFERGRLTTTGDR